MSILDGLGHQVGLATWHKAEIGTMHSTTTHSPSQRTAEDSVTIPSACRALILML